jgi:6-phosphogluconolactonase
VLSEDGRWLLSVNAGSSQVSVFAVKPDRLDLTDVADSGGAHPISLAMYEDLVYVLNAGDPGNITGFRLSHEGRLKPIEGSTQPLSNKGEGAAPAPAQVSFAPDGETLVVTEKMTNLIDTYRVKDGAASTPDMHPSAGMTPFGFDFSRRDIVIVSEAFGGEPGKSALSSYRVDEDHFKTLSPSVGTTQTAACWVIVSKDGRYAYTTNAGSGSISSYRVAQDGSITLEDATAGKTGEGSSPIDLALSMNGRYLYSLNSGAHTISAFMFREDGSLMKIDEFSVPEGAVGLAAR